MQIKDLVDGVYHKLAKRTDSKERAPFFIKDAVLELTESYDFEELRTTGPNTNFEVDVAEYSPTKFTNSNERATQVISWFVELDSSTGVGLQLKYRTPPVVESLSRISGVPSKWTRVGDRLIVGCKPQSAYATQMRYQREHPFQGSIEGCELWMPNSWREIVEYAAAERGAIELRLMDYALTYNRILYGDPLFQTSGGTKGTPGLIFKRTSQRERDSSNNERQLKPIVHRYTR